MAHFNRLIMFLVTGTLLVTCSSENRQTASETLPPVEINTPLGQLSVQAVEIQIFESFPLQVTATVSGTLPEPCQLLNVDTAQQNRTFFITLTVVENTSACSATDNLFTKVVPLDVDGLKAGIYHVDVHGRTAQFELVVDNIVHW